MDSLEREDRPELDAWKITSGGETDRIVVGQWFTSSKRIEIDPDDLLIDPDGLARNTERDSDG